MFTVKDEYGTRIYPFVDNEDAKALASAGYVYVPTKFYTLDENVGAVQINIQLGFIDREKWERLEKAVRLAIVMAEQQAGDKS